MLSLNISNRGIDSFDLLTECGVEYISQRLVLLVDEVFNGCNESQPFTVALVLNALRLGIHDNSVHTWQPIDGF